MGGGEERITARWRLDRRPWLVVNWWRLVRGGAETYGDEGAGAGQGGAGRPWACRACIWGARHHLSAVSMFFTDRTCTRCNARRVKMVLIGAVNLVVAGCSTGRIFSWWVPTGNSRFGEC